MNPFNKFKARIKQYGVKNTIFVQLPRHIGIVLDSLLTPKVIDFFKRCSLKNTIVLESHNDFDSNGGAFYNWLINNKYNNHYKIVWLLYGRHRKTLPKNVKAVQINRPSIHKAYYLATSKYILTCHKIIGSCRPSQTTVYMTHGTFTVKLATGFVTIPPNLTYCLIPSYEVADLQAKQFELAWPNNQFAVVGFPCQDCFYSNEPGDLQKITAGTYNKTILWMPTFRKGAYGGRNDSTLEEPLGIPVFIDVAQLANLNTLLNKNNSLLIIKIHPMQDLQVVKIPHFSNIVVLTGESVKTLGVDNYWLMKDVSALISDYSSAAFDFLHLHKPLAFTVDDMADYKLGFVVDNPTELMGGMLIHDERDFTNFIESVLRGEDPYQQKREQIFKKIYAFHDGDSSKRLAKLIGLDKDSNA